MGISEFNQIEELFASRGVCQIYIKHLSKKQDNDKNQIYFGTGLDGVANLFPAILSLRSASNSKQKRKSKHGLYIIEAKLDFEWLKLDGTSYSAPGAKIIDYFQYPEVRMSGFLTKCPSPPDALRRTRQQLYGKRILILGANNNGKTYGLVITELEDNIVSDFPELSQLQSSHIFSTHIIGHGLGSNPRNLLVSELKKIAGSWIPSITLKPGDKTPSPFKGNQGAGFTLEALLDITRNSSKEPDKHGYEIKSFKQSGKISLMTPTADAGREGALSFREFMDSYGWVGKKGDGRIVFNGIHRYHELCKSSGLTLDIIGFDDITKMFTEDTKDIMVCLCREDDELVSGWTFNKLLEGWSKKHNSACYVEYDKRTYTGEDNNHDNEYMFTGNVYFGEGTSIFNYLKSIISKIIYYDAGHEISADGSAHQRPQWRISVNQKFVQSLGQLYNDVSEVCLSEK
ncbi:MAG: MvaI/BcnI family restriction endonuclease [Geobacteraceae bacterium]|nr:MvaI/BcnI family restriction endonuclease [Geobacteraceae bacterium]